MGFDSEVRTPAELDDDGQQTNPATLTSYRGDEFDLTATRLSDTGTAPLRVELREVRPGSTVSEEGTFDRSGTVDLAPSQGHWITLAQASNGLLAPTSPPTQDQRALGLFETFLTAMVTAFPDEEIGPGARWTRSEHLDSSSDCLLERLRSERVWETTLAELDADTYQLTGTARFSLIGLNEANPNESPSFEDVRELTFDVTGRFDQPLPTLATVTLTHRLAHDGEVSQTATQTTTMRAT
ncbi:MAG: hypothetical protein ACKV2O_13690 [Acidimicrobiales bacterium]